MLLAGRRELGELEAVLGEFPGELWEHRFDLEVYLLQLLLEETKK